MTDPVVEAANKATREGKLALIDFTAPWCTACDVQERILHDIQDRIVQKSTVTIVDLENQPDLAEKYDILSLPSVFIFSGHNKPVWRSSGRVVQASELLGAIDSLTSPENAKSDQRSPQ